MVDGQDNTWRSRAPGPHAHGNTVRQIMDGLWTAKTVKRPRQQPAQPQYANYRAPLTRKQHAIQHSPSTPTTGLCERRNDTSRSTGRSGRQKEATRRNMRREERVTVHGPVKKQQPDGMSHRGGGGGANGFFVFFFASQGGYYLFLHLLHFPPFFCICLAFSFFLLWQSMYKFVSHAPF